MDGSRVFGSEQSVDIWGKKSAMIDIRGSFLLCFRQFSSSARSCVTDMLMAYHRDKVKSLSTWAIVAHSLLERALMIRKSLTVCQHRVDHHLGRVSSHDLSIRYDLFVGLMDFLQLQSYSLDPNREVRVQILYGCEIFPILQHLILHPHSR